MERTPSCRCAVQSHTMHQVEEYTILAISSHGRTVRNEVLDKKLGAALRCLENVSIVHEQWDFSLCRDYQGKVTKLNGQQLKSANAGL